MITNDVNCSSKLRGELDNEVKQQALFKLLGQDYVTMYFRNARYTTFLTHCFKISRLIKITFSRFKPALLEPPKTKPEVREAYMEEMRLLLEDQIIATQKDMGLPEDYG